MTQGDSYIYKAVKMMQRGKYHVFTRSPEIANKNLWPYFFCFDVNDILTRKLKYIVVVVVWHIEDVLWRIGMLDGDEEFPEDFIFLFSSYIWDINRICFDLFLGRNVYKYLTFLWVNKNLIASVGHQNVERLVKIIEVKKKIWMLSKNFKICWSTKFCHDLVFL